MHFPKLSTVDALAGRTGWQMAKCYVAFCVRNESLSANNAMQADFFQESKGVQKLWLWPQTSTRFIIQALCVFLVWISMLLVSLCAVRDRGRLTALLVLTVSSVCLLLIVSLTQETQVLTGQQGPRVCRTWKETSHICGAHTAATCCYCYECGLIQLSVFQFYTKKLKTNSKQKHNMS